MLAEKLLSSSNKDDMTETMFNLYQHVKEHFVEEETIMKETGFHHYKSHAKEHNLMLGKLLGMDKKIQQDNWKTDDVHEFIDKWTQHITHSDMAFNQHWKEMNKYCM
jgi:putative two-component system hydrogenase maturation factor HypX/HoxX